MAGQAERTMTTTLIYILGDREDEIDGINAWVLVVNGKPHSVSRTERDAKDAARMVKEARQ
jgi:hypothetical protein